MTAKILIVDDEPDLEILIRQKFKNQIKSGNIEFAFARNGNEALEMLAGNGRYDLLFTDINMPGMDGLTLLQKVSELNYNFHSIVVSAYGDIDNIRKAMNNGAFDFLVKPIDFNDLELIAEKAMREIEVKINATKTREQLMLVNNELEIAKNIQQSLLPDPDRFIQVCGGKFELSAKMEAAKEVGGDFYDFYFLDKNRLAFVVGDVSGKGVPAALIMAMTKILIKSALLLQNNNIRDSVNHVNRIMTQETISSMFVTLFVGVIDSSTNKFEFVNAGHNRPFFIDIKHHAAELESEPQLPIGVMEEIEYSSNEMVINPGEAIFIFTDGITEAFNVKEECYSEERLAQKLAEKCNGNAKSTMEFIFNDVKEFSKHVPQSDDITAVVIKYVG